MMTAGKPRAAKSAGLVWCAPRRLQEKLQPRYAPSSAMFPGERALSQRFLTAAPADPGVSSVERIVCGPAGLRDLAGIAGIEKSGG